MKAMWDEWFSGVSWREQAESLFENFSTICAFGQWAQEPASHHRIASSMPLT